MNPPEEVIVDRASLAEYKKIMAEVQADADFQMKKATQSMSAGDRTKLNRLLKNIEVLGDVGKAAAKSRVSRTLLDKWMNAPGVCWHINKTVMPPEGYPSILPIITTITSRAIKAIMIETILFCCSSFNFIFLANVQIPCILITVTRHR
jgi:hypothetical protein